MSSTWLVYYAEGPSVVFIGDAQSALEAIAETRRRETDMGWPPLSIVVRQIKIGVNYVCCEEHGPVALNDSGDGLAALREAAEHENNTHT